MIVGLYTLFDGGRDTITLESLIKDAKTVGHDVTALTSKLSALSNRVAKIRLLRHKLFAHRDHNMAYNDVSRRPVQDPDEGIRFRRRRKKN